MEIEQLAKEIIAGRRLTRKDDLSVFERADLEELAKGADAIREAFCGSHVDLCTIINGRAGRCSENCKFCAQSAHNHTGCEVHGMLAPEEVLEDCRKREAAGVHAVKSQDELFQTCDIVSLHIPATPETIKSIDYKTVNQLPKGGILINTARKEVINEPELLKLLAEREDLKFITDIKPDADADFAKFEGRYFSTPKKMGAQTAEANINAGIAAAKQINAFFADGCTKYQVNK